MFPSLFLTVTDTHRLLVWITSWQGVGGGGGGGWRREPVPCMLCRGHECCFDADLSGGALDSDSCQLFCRLAMQTGALNIHRFSALLQDFGSLARGEGTSDVLLAYEL